MSEHKIDGGFCFYWVDPRNGSVFSTNRLFFLRRRFPLLPLLVLLALFSYFIYEVQYKNGIEILPFIPIDDSGFELYNYDSSSDVKVSKGALNEPTKGSILCWIMTTSINHKTRVPAVAETWSSNCDSAHFLTNSDRFLPDDLPFHTIFKDLPESYYKLFWKTRRSLNYVYRNISSEFDWYVKADDDTYIVMENLRRYLEKFDPNKPYYIGFRLKRRAPEHGYNSGGSGYVVSRAAMRMFSEQLYADKYLCPYHEWEDYAIARCFGSLGIHATDTRDELNRQRFLPWRPEEHYKADLMRSFLMDPIEHTGLSIFHENLIGMHHLSPDELRLIHGLLYGVARGIYQN